MVSFQCDGCGDTIKKPQLDKHRNRCWSTFSCIDCSTTFHGTDYKSHTSCISEAEKYQGALYKGKKAGGHAGNNAAKDQNGRYQPYPTTKPTQAAATQDAPVEPAAAAEENTPSAPAIHPSRTALLNGPDPALKPRPARSAFPSLHPGANYPPPRAYGRGRQQQGQQQGTKNYATGMNGFMAGDAPMRSWGGSPVPEGETEASSQPSAAVVNNSVGVAAAAPVVDDGEKKKKKKKKGDKGGTGSRANSNTAKRAETADVVESSATTQSATPTTTTDADADAVKATAEAPAVVIPATPMATDAQHTRVSSDAGDSKKKRKADNVAGDASSSKTAKKLRKALHALAAAEKASVPLSTLIEKISEQVSKKGKADAGVIDATGIARDIKVKFVQGSEGQEGSWVLEV